MLKNSLFSGAFALLMSFTAQATLIGDQIDGTSSGILDFDDTDVVVSGTLFEFDGTVFGTSGQDFDTIFDFFAPSSVDILSFLIESADGSDVADTVSFSVTFSGLNWVGEPNRILTGIDVILDDPFALDGAGLAGTVSNNAFTLVFTDFFIQEFRELEIELLTEIDMSPSTPNPVPEPATVALLSMGLFGMALRKKRA